VTELSTSASILKAVAFLIQIIHRTLKVFQVLAIVLPVALTGMLPQDALYIYFDSYLTCVEYP